MSAALFHIGSWQQGRNHLRLHLTDAQRLAAMIRYWGEKYSPSENCEHYYELQTFGPSAD